MSKVERKEFKESTKIVRSTNGNVNNFDNSLDYLLEDLQNTVSRPGSSLANGTTGSNKYTGLEMKNNSMNRMITKHPVKEYSEKDSHSFIDESGNRHFKTTTKEAYSYKSTDGGEKMRMENNIHQLDSLLDDLQQVKPSGYNNNVTSKSAYQAYSEKTISGSGRTTPTYSHRSRSADRHSENTYGDIKSLRTMTPSPTRSNTSTLNRSTQRITNVQEYPTEVIQTTTPDIHPEILASLDPELLPGGNTKVTTTIKTYTYEIPGSTPLDSDKYTYSASPNTTITTPSKSFVYNKNESNTLSKNYYSSSSGYQSPSPTFGSPGSDRKVIKETITTKNYQPPNRYNQEPGKHTYVYNESQTTRRYVDHPENTPPSRNEYHNTHVSRNVNRNVNTNINRTDVYSSQTHSTDVHNRSDSPDSSHLPPVPVTIQRFDSMSNLNARHHPDTELFDPKYGPGSNRPNSRPTTPSTPEVNVTYKYRSQTNTQNVYRPVGEEPALPGRFPTDQVEPPKKLDELMATIGNEPPTNAYNSGWAQHEEDVVRQRKVESLKSHKEYEDQQRKPETKNVSGPPVYYPPGHEMFAKKEESGAWRAEGAMAKESGKYKYEAESKSKSKSSSGAAIVPVCLPLCCGLPCTIL